VERQPVAADAGRRPGAFRSKLPRAGGRRQALGAMAFCLIGGAHSRGEGRSLAR